MAIIQDEECNFLFGELENELRIAAQSDDLKRKQNDAKLRAVNQNVETYDEFREMVNAAHLKPLDKSDKIQRPKTIWNTFATKRKTSTKKTVTSSNSDNMITAKQAGVPNGSYEFLKQWRKVNTTNRNRYCLLKSIGRNCLAKILSSEVSFGLLGDVISCLCEHEDTIEDFAFVVHTLEILCRMRRFTLALQFLTVDEKQQCRALFQGLKNNMCYKLQDLAEIGITEWSLQELDKKYEI